MRPTADIISDIALIVIVVIPAALIALRFLVWIIECQIMAMRGYWFDSGFHGGMRYVNPRWRDKGKKRPDIPSRFFIP